MSDLQVTLKECDTFDLRVLKGPSDYLAAANSTETTEKMEVCMKVWIKQIEQVKCVSEQMMNCPQKYHIFLLFSKGQLLDAIYSKYLNEQNI